MRVTTFVLDGADNTKSSDVVENGDASSADEEQEKKETTVSNNTTNAAKPPLHAIKGVYERFAHNNRFTQAWGNPGIPVVEFPINSFVHWYKDLRFAKHLLNYSNLFEGNHREWDFKVIVINESSWPGEHQKRDEAALKWAQQVAT